MGFDLLCKEEVEFGGRTKTRDTPLSYVSNATVPHVERHSATPLCHTPSSVGFLCSRWIHDSIDRHFLLYIHPCPLGTEI